MYKFAFNLPARAIRALWWALIALAIGYVSNSIFPPFLLRLSFCSFFYRPQFPIFDFIGDIQNTKREEESNKKDRKNIFTEARAILEGDS